MRTIVALSGGKASAWCADWALRHYPKDNVILYFNDTKWEHPDLYRFLDDLEKHFEHPITRDSDGRSVEGVAYDEHAIPNNRMPFCSRILKAKRLQAFYQTSDQLVFGIGLQERHRSSRLLQVYNGVEDKLGKCSTLRFPLIEESVQPKQIDQFLVDAGIEEPKLYQMGFTHNNCSGGCVRGSKRQWIHLLDVLPEVYAERERFEREFREKFNKDVSILKNTTLEELRIQHRLQIPFDFSGEEDVTDCIGICDMMA
jgi:3'-phosphoadenosine 5'-phosphosulfate sulfotransferase (PAPS reductase)/FAD synthetase